METLAKLRLVLRGNERALLAAITANSLFVGYGALMGYTSPAIPNLNSHKNPFHVTRMEHPWVGSIVFLGAVAGGLPSGPLTDYLGRKLAIISTALLAVVGLTVVAGSSSVQMMYAGMFIAGFSANAISTSILVYTAEIAPSDLRGFLMCLFNVFWSVGNLLVYAAGSVLPWNWLAVVSASFFVVPLFALLFFAESPRWFLLKGNREAAVFTLRWFRGEQADVDDEIRIVENSLRYASNGFSAYLELLHVDNVKPLVVCLLLMGAQQFCGSEVLQAFSVTLFQDAGLRLNAYVQTIIIGLLAVLGSTASVLVIGYLGRKKTLVVSSIMMAVSMAVTGAFFKVQEVNAVFAEEHLFWLPVVSFSISNFSFYLGINPIVWIYSCELFATNVRAAASSVVSLSYGVFGFFAVITFGQIRETLHNSGMFWLYGGVAAFGTAVTLTVVPPDNENILE